MSGPFDAQVLAVEAYDLYTGDYIIVEPIAEGNKVQAQIVYILYPRQIKFLKEDSKWLVTIVSVYV